MLNFKICSPLLELPHGLTEPQARRPGQMMMMIADETVMMMFVMFSDDSFDDVPPLPDQEQYWRDLWQTHRGRQLDVDRRQKAPDLRPPPTLGPLLLLLSSMSSITRS